MKSKNRILGLSFASILGLLGQDADYEFDTSSRNYFSSEQMQKYNSYMEVQQNQRVNSSANLMFWPRLKITTHISQNRIS